MVFKTAGNKSAPVILFFHAMGVTGESSMPVAEKLEKKFYCVMPTSTVYCAGQFAQIGKVTRRIMVPFLYLAIKSLYWSKGKTLRRIMWCDDESIKLYFIDAGKKLTYGNLRRQMTDSLEDKPFPELQIELQKHTFWEFVSIEEHFKYRNAVMQTYTYGNFPVFEGCNHMQYQIKDPEGFAKMLEIIIATGRLPQLEFLSWRNEDGFHR